jgi:MFS family permease
MRDAFSYRWIAVAVFILSSTLNYLDRGLLNVFGPMIVGEFKISMTDFGLLISAFSFTYAASSLFAGWFLDRVGVNRGIRAAVAWWSAASIASAFTRSLSALAVCRAALGIGESAGVPAVGKLNGLYLKPEERALGAALNQIGLSLGAVIAPLWLELAIATRSWRAPFFVTGVLGFVWIPLWAIVNRRIPPRYADQEFVPRAGSGFGLLRDRNLQLLVLANILWMGTYSLWSNWTAIYLMQSRQLPLRQAAYLSSIPPLISNLGGFFGGWLSLRWMRHGRPALDARRWAIWASAAGSLVTVLLPFAPDARWATAVISLSFFFALSGSVNLYALPIDLFGPARSGFAIAALTFAFGLLQTIVSPIIGYLQDHRLYCQVVWICTVPMILSALVLQRLSARESGPQLPR